MGNFVHFKREKAYWSDYNRNANPSTACLPTGSSLLRNITRYLLSRCWVRVVGWATLRNCIQFRKKDKPIFALPSIARPPKTKPSRTSLHMPSLHIYQMPSLHVPSHHISEETAWEAYLVHTPPPPSGIRQRWNILGYEFKNISESLLMTVVTKNHQWKQNASIKIVYNV